MNTFTKFAILNANYPAGAGRLDKFYRSNGLVAHECILDLRAFHSVTAEDVAKRLMDSRARESFFAAALLKPDDVAW